MTVVGLMILYFINPNLFLIFFIFMIFCELIQSKNSREVKPRF